MGEYGGRSVGQGRYGGSDERGDVSRSSGRANRGDWKEGGEDRGFFDRASDEVASWFGDEEAARRREQDHRGRGPVNYRRSDERILEDACDHLTEDRYVDASNIQVTVLEGEVTLDGTVGSRQQKRRAEDCVHDLSGVKHVQNNLRIQERDEWSRSGSDQTSRSSSDTTPGTLA
jgi:osmotically-inducible protein OsmY